jgi:peptidyl-dipeptidase A
MSTRRVFACAASALALMALAACATPPPAPAEAPPAGPTVADAEAFVARAEAELAALSEHEGRTAWVYENFITYDTERLLERVTADGIAARVRYASDAAQYANLALSPELKRKIDFLHLGLTLPAPSGGGQAQALAEITTRLQSTYSTGRIEHRGRTMTLDELEVAMREVRDPARLEEMWTKWREVSKPMAADYARMVAIANEGAHELGFEDVGRMWLSNYDMTPDAMSAEVERLWGQVRPLYEQVHCHVRAGLNARYGDAIVPLDQPIRADLLGNMWAQDWSALYDMVGPRTGGPTYDLTRQLVRNDYDARKLVQAGERFYTSLGLAPLPDTFWERSLLVRPADRDVVCHASAWDIDARDDIRIKMCIHVNEDDFKTVHHELGHNYYQRAYQNQPYLFQGGAHDGFHEAIGDFIALNTTPAYLDEIDLIRTAQIPPAGADTSLLFQQALDKIAFMPFAYLMDKWRWGVFAGDITPENYNSAWWELVQRYQGVRAPSERPADAFDPGAKYHIAGNTPYLRYFLAYVLEFQFYKAACEQAGWQGPLHRCTIYGDTEIGARFNRMMEMGASRPWPDALEAFTGQRQMDASAMVAYFQPLMGWLEEQNAGRQCGWPAP